MKTIACLTLAVFIAASCNRNLSPAIDRDNREWVVTEINGTPVLPSSDHQPLYLQFSSQDKRFTGHAGCNRISGNYTLENKDNIRFGEVLSTKMSCDAISLETNFLSTLRQISHYEFSGNTLLLGNGSQALIRLEPHMAN